MIPIVDDILGHFSQDLGIDLGTVNTLVHVKGKGIVVREPSIVVLHKKSKQIIAIGSEAKKMVGKIPANLVIVKPLKDGVISDYDTTLAMLSHFVKKIHQVPGKKLSIPRPKVVIGTPSNISEVERRALLDVARDAGAREVYLVEEPMVAAIGAHLPVSEPVGSMIVDIGGGTSEVAIVSLGGVVAGHSLKVAGDAMDLEIIGYLRSRWGLAIGEKTAEEIKISLGSAIPMQIEKEMTIRGLDLEQGLPESIKLSSVQVREALATTINTIVAAIRDVLHDGPPELISDIAERGIVLCGGGSLVFGLPKLISQETRMPVLIVEEPLSCVVRGCAILLEDLDLLSKVKIANAKA